jgi:hypothetical protein
VQRDRPKSRFTEFACVSREFGPPEPASGPFSDAHRRARSPVATRTEM